MNTIVDFGTMPDRPHLSFFLDDPPEQLLVQPDYRARRNVELHFERSRLLKFPHFPSRANCCFASIDSEQASFWATKDARRGGAVCRLFPSSQSTITLFDFTWYNFAVRVAKGQIDVAHPIPVEIERAAFGYWSGSSIPGVPAKIEALIQGPVVILD